MRKKMPSTSATAAVKAMINAASPLPEIPKNVKLRDGDLPFWDSIVRAKTRDEWLGPDLVVAAQLARCQHDIERESVQLDIEGSVIENGRGTPVMNPRHAVLEQLARREMALMRSLRLAGVATGRQENVETARRLQKQAEKAKNELADDEDLLAV